MDELRLATDEGVPFDAHLHLPAGAARAPALVVVHEWWGLTAEMDRMAAAFAEEGFLALAVDLYGGARPATEAAAAQAMQALDSRAAARVVAAGAAHLAAHPRSTGKVGVTGFCMGGAITFVAACHVPQARAFAPFYGIPVARHVDWKHVHGPVQAHFAAKDAWASPEKAHAIRDAVVAAGGRCEVFTYQGGHAFMRASDPRVFHAESARLAWQRVTAFFRAELT